MYAKFIQNYIEDTRIIYADKVSNALAEAFDLDLKRASFITNNYLKRQFDADRLHRVIKGVYCKKIVTPFGVSVVCEDEVITAFLLDDYNGYVTGPTFFNQIGLSTWMPANLHIASNKFSTKAKDNNISVYRPVVKITKKNKKYLQILDCIRDLTLFAVDNPTPGKAIYRFIIDNNLDFFQLIMTAHSFYKDSVTKELLNIFGKENIHEFA